MTQQSALLAASRRWWRSRRLLYVGILFALAVLGYWVHDWLFTPADLRRVQGVWEVYLRAGDDEEMKWGGRLSIDGRRYSWIDGPAKSGTFQFRLVPEERQFIVQRPATLSILGQTFPLPPLLFTPEDLSSSTYELGDESLSLDLQGNAEARLRPSLQLVRRKK